MKREIKFRAWNGNTMVSPDYITRDGCGFWKEHSIPVMSKELMQYTGLKDKHGTEIYEGDIVHKQCYDGVTDYEYIGVLVWHHDGFALSQIKGSDKAKRNVITGIGSYDNEKERLIKEEVIGNIYQHPHLLK